MKSKKLPVRKVVECALLIALEVVLNRFASFQLLGLKFGLSFLPMALCAMLFGPWWAAVCYAVSDVIGALPKSLKRLRSRRKSTPASARFWT